MSYLFNLSVYLFIILWIIRSFKDILFFVYLWQLKEYHFGRFINHFKTENGKRILLNKMRFLKIILFFTFFIFPQIYYLIFLLYLFENFIFVLKVLTKKLIKPVITTKSLFLVFLNVLVFVLFAIFSLKNIENFYYIISIIILIDILLVFIVSFIILGLEPLSILARKNIIKKATQKRIKFKNLKVIGITGSYGKTAVKEILFSLISGKFNTLKTAEHRNSEMGISKTILEDLNSKHEVFICEMGAYNVGGIKMLTDIVNPEIGILTGISSQHMSTFGSQENIIKAKYELIESLPEYGLAIFNGFNKYCKDLYLKTNISKTISGLVNNGDIWVENIVVKKKSTSFKVVLKNGESEIFELNIAGIEFMENFLLAVLATKKLGMSLAEITEESKKIDSKLVGLNIKAGINGVDVIDSTYSSNLNAVISHIEHLKLWEGKRIIIMKCLIELGSDSKKVHEIIGKEIAKVCGLAIITTNECFDVLKDSAVSEGMDAENIIFMNDPEKILERIGNFNLEKDVILLENRISKNITKRIKNI